ncbi:MAG: hypothetical protein ISS56_03675 [Anaerolineae bacterium]|nr:hypothetical protein [Anaerolineae bacterium]
MIYLQLFRYLVPLVFTMIAQEFSGQVLNGGMARMPRATETLAGYGLAVGLVTFLTSPLLQARQLGLVLVESRPEFRRVLAFVLLSGALLAAILACLALTPLGTWVIEGWHDAPPPLAAVAREALLWLAPMPILRSLFLFYSGLLMRIRRTDVVSYAILAGIGASIAAVFALLPAGFVRERPIRLPLLVTYAGIAADLSIVLWGYQRYVRRTLGETDGGQSLRYVFRFYWPLALVMAIQGFSRPLINLFVSRGTDGAEALAVLTVVYSLAHLPYGWVNEIRSLPVAFKDRENSLAAIRRFALGCGLLSFGVMLVLFWTPLRTVILESWIGVEAELAAPAAMPLRVFTFFPLTVMVRAYLHGIGLLEHRTKALAPSAPARIAAILIALVILSAFPMHGATRAILALFCGFAAEMLVVWRSVQGGRYGRREYLARI